LRLNSPRRGATDSLKKAGGEARPGYLAQKRARSPGNIAIRYGAKAYFAAKVTVREPNKQGAMPDDPPGATLKLVKTTDV
jgi:hypothetical protein